MNKIKLVSSFILLSSLLVPTFSSTVEVNADEDITLSNEIVTEFKNTLSKGYELKSRLTFSYPYDLGSITLPYLDVIDQVDDNNRVHKVQFESYTLNELYITKGSGNSANKRYLSIGNTVELNSMLNDAGEAIKFDGNYDSPFKALVKLSAAQINKYFEVKHENGCYVLNATSYLYGYITTQFNTFFSEYDLFPWDASVTSTISDFKFEIDNEGRPTKLSFNKIKKDLYGGIVTTFNSDFRSITTVDTLTPYASTLDQDLTEQFTDNMTNFQAKLDAGNFTETITIGSLTYSNYYQFDSNVNAYIGPMMLSDNVLYAQGYGNTYTGVAKEGNSYYRVGVSYESDFSDRLDSLTYTNVKDVIPNISNISADFFTYEDGVYTFDIASFLYDDFDFSVDVLEAIVGLMDNMVAIIGVYLADGINYNFQSLQIMFDTDSTPIMYLIFENEGYLYGALYQFSNVGTTDLTKVKSLEPVISYLSSY